MNELEKALEQLNIKYEISGKQYKIPTTKENLIELLKGYMALTNHLEEKINNAVEYIKESNTYYEITHYIPEDEKQFKINMETLTNHLLDILKENK